jgi:hypothetical protein
MRHLEQPCNKTAAMIVTKLDAARRQLETALVLWIHDGDPVSIHTLVYAAYQVIHDLNRHAKGPPLMLDMPFIGTNDRAAFINAVKQWAVFFKHADDRTKGKKKGTPAPSSTITFNPAINEMFFVYALIGLEYLKERLSPQEIAFKVWYSVHNPDQIDRDQLRVQRQVISKETAQWLRGMPKKECFKALLSSYSGPV